MMMLFHCGAPQRMCAKKNFTRRCFCWLRNETETAWWTEYRKVVFLSFFPSLPLYVFFLPTFFTSLLHLVFFTARFPSKFVYASSPSSVMKYPQLVSSRAVSEISEWLVKRLEDLDIEQPGVYSRLVLSLFKVNTIDLLEIPRLKVSPWRVRSAVKMSSPCDALMLMALWLTLQLIARWKIISFLAFTRFTTPDDKLTKFTIFPFLSFVPAGPEATLPLAEQKQWRIEASGGRREFNGSFSRSQREFCWRIPSVTLSVFIFLISRLLRVLHFSLCCRLVLMSPELVE